MPATTPLMKVNRTKSYGAEVVLYGDVYDEACEYALSLAREKGYTFIHPFDDPAVATGQGTIAMEIIKELPLVDYILVPIGGGGLATGVSTLAKLLNPKIQVIGVEPQGAACMKASLEKGEVVTLPTVNTIADGTAVKTPGSTIFPYIQKNIDEILTVSDDELIVAFLDMVENHKNDRGEFGASDGGRSQASECEREKSGFRFERRQYGRHHHVLCRTARADSERPDFHGFCPAAGPSRRAGACGFRDRPGTGETLSSWIITSS